MQNDDAITAARPMFARVRVERSIVFVAQKVMDEYTALGGESLAELNIDPDTPIGRAHTMVVRGWAHGSDGIMGYLAQWGLLESEVQAIHKVKVYVDGELIHEEDLA